MKHPLRYYSLVQGTDGEGQAGTVEVGVTHGGLIALRTKGRGAQVLLDEHATTELVAALRDAVKCVAGIVLVERSTVDES